MIALYSEEKFDSIDEKYTAIQREFYKDFKKLAKKHTVALERNKAVIRFFAVNNIEFCECDYLQSAHSFEQGIIKRLNNFKKVKERDILFAGATIDSILSDSLISTELHNIDLRFEPWSE